MWVPSHIGITGNTLADEAAKYATNAPIIHYASQNKNDITKIISNTIKQIETDDWENYQHHYKLFNPNRITPIYPPSASRLNLQKYIRLRLGHTYFTHRHLFNQSTPDTCPLCNTEMLNIHHLIFRCNIIKQAQIALLGRVCLPELLHIINTNNINSVQNILKYCNIYHLI